MIVAFFFPFYSLQHFLFFFCPFALVRNSNKMFNRSNIQPFTDLKEKVFNIKYSVCPGIWIFYQIKEAHVNSQGSFFFFFLNHARELLDWRIPTAPGTEAPTLRAHPDHSSMDLFISMFVCNLYNKLVILF